MNEEKIVKIENNKIIIPEEPKIEDVPPIIEVPKLPVTGM